MFTRLLQGFHERRMDLRRASRQLARVLLCIYKASKIESLYAKFAYRFMLPSYKDMVVSIRLLRCLHKVCRDLHSVFTRFAKPFIQALQEQLFFCLAPLISNHPDQELQLH